MKFLITNLQSGEKVMYRAKIHIILFLQPAILLTVGLLCYLDNARITHYLGVTVLFLGLVSLVQRVLVKVGSVYAVTDKRVILKTGIISRRVAELRLVKCEGLSISQGVIGRLLGFGTILLTTGGIINVFPYVADPVKFRNAINEQL